MFGQGFNRIHSTSGITTGTPTHTTDSKYATVAVKVPRSETQLQWELDTSTLHWQKSRVLAQRQYTGDREPDGAATNGRTPHLDARL